MRRRGGAAAPKSPKKSKSLLSPLPVDSPDRPSKRPKSYDFDLDILSGSGKKASASASAAAAVTSPLHHSTLPQQRTPGTISGLRDLASSRVDAVKRSLDHFHSEILKEFEASKSRISKRFKMQTQACIQISDEAEKEYKKISDRINENTDLFKSSYAEFINEAQASASRVCKVSIPELAQSMEKAIEGLRSRSKIPSTPT